MEMVGVISGISVNAVIHMSAMTQSALDTYDIVGIVLYFVIVVGVGLLSMCTSKRNTVTGYFLANKENAWYIVGASLFASNIGTEHFIGLAGSGAAVGVSVGAFEISGLVALQILGWVFLPVYIASKAYTLPEYIKKRFGGTRIRVYLAVLSLTLYIIIKISVALYAGILFINQGLHWNKWLAILLLLAITAVSAVTGGLKAAIYTEVLQAITTIVGTGTIFIIAFVRIGGYQNLVKEYPNARADSTNITGCNKPLPDAFVMLREPTDPNLPWIGFLLGQSIVSLWYWAADQMMVQRALSSKSLSHARGGCLVAGYCKFVFLFVTILPGMIGRVLWRNEIGCSDPDQCEAICGNRRGCSDTVYPRLVMELLPSGLRGLMLAVMLASLVSDLLSIFNSASALFTIDIYSRVRRKATSREILIVGRLFNGLLLVISVLWLPLIDQLQGGQLFFYLKSVAAYLSPPIGAIFILAVFWKRCNESGAFYGLMIGLLSGVIRMVLDFVYRSPECGSPDIRPLITKNLHYLYFAFIMFVLTVLVAVVVSLATPAPAEEKLIRTTYATRFDSTRRPDDFLYDRRRSQLASLTRRTPPAKADGDFPAKVSDEETQHYNVLPGSVGENPIVQYNSSSVGNGVTIVADGDGRSPPLTPVPVEKADTLWSFKSFAGRMVNWFCGFSQLTIEEKDEHDAHLAKVSSLEQDSRAKWFLNVNLAVLLFLVFFVLLFFSTDLHDLAVSG